MHTSHPSHPPRVLHWYLTNTFQMSLCSFGTQPGRAEPVLTALPACLTTCLLADSQRLKFASSE